MSTDYQPGRIVSVQWTGTRKWDTALVVKQDGHWVEVLVAGHEKPMTWHVADVRPLVVLDPADAAVAAFLDYHRADDAERPSGACPASYALADVIREQTKPPRIPEPGLWGVVEAKRRELNGSTTTAEGKWIRVDAMVCPWSHTSGNYTADWDDLIDPTLIREGLS